MVAKNISDSKLVGRSKMEKSKLRWLVDVENDIRDLNVIKWRLMASNKEDSASVIKEDKALRGPYSQRVSIIREIVLPSIFVASSHSYIYSYKKYINIYYVCFEYQLS
jgi:hypothetical protein